MNKSNFITGAVVVVAIGVAGLVLNEMQNTTIGQKIRAGFGGGLL